MFRRMGMLLLMALIAQASWSTTDSLAQWRQWVAEGHPQLACPWIAAEGEQHQCVWPAQMRVDVEAAGLAFSLEVTVYGERTLVALPGDIRHWPQQVTLNGEAAPLVERSGQPHLSLVAGRHRIAGQFRWIRQPGQLSVPQNIALITLYRNGQLQTVDRRNDQLVLSNRPDKTHTPQGRDSLGIEVYRKLSDGIPLLLETQIQLTVSGKPREVVFGRAQPHLTELLALRSPLPARVEANGSIRAQVTPGEHVLHLISRFRDNPASLQLVQPLTEEWPRVEYLSFEADNQLRQLQLSGAASVDTSQIALPSGWAQLPTYRLDGDTTLVLEAIARGDHAPAANEFNVRRDLWLDFDGDGITTLDRISGQMHQQWRLNAATDARIGRASVDDVPVLITTHEGRDGIEIRSPAINMKAVTRQASINSLPAIGWDARAETYSATLHLPPGWRSLHAAGVDGVSGTWLSYWNLWDVFLLLIIVAATRKLFDNRGAVLAAITYLLALQEPGTPLLVVPVLLVVIALLPLGARWIRSTLIATGGLASLVLVLVFISFAVDGFRLAIYPSLERAGVGQYRPASVAEVAGYSAAPALQDQILEEAESLPTQKLLGRKSVAADAATREQPTDLYQLADDDRVQTGPGLPTWTWRAVTLQASGPVAADETLKLYYTSPWQTAFWRVLMVLCAGAYSALVLQRFAVLVREVWSPPSRSALASPLLALAIMTCLWQPAAVIAEEYPPEYLLNQLEQRLTRAPDCLPHCVSLNNGKLKVQGEALVFTFDVYVDTTLAVPLPAAGDNFQVLVVRNGEDELPLVRDAEGVVSAALPAGHNTLQIFGTLAGDQASVQFPLAVHNLEVVAPEWQVDGLVDGRVVNNTLTFRSLSQTRAQDRDTLKSSPAPVFVEVQRRFNLHKQWRLQTNITRLAPESGPLSVAVPLLAGEKMLSDVGVVRDGVVHLQFGQNQRTLTWLSSMEPVAQLQLEAATNAAYVEQWLFTPSSRWRLSYDGLPPVKSSTATSTLTPVFKPWPGEQLQVTIERPEGVAGPTHTVESAALEYNAGSRLQKSRLTLDVRASLGEDYTLTLPAGAEVLSVANAGRNLNLPGDNVVSVPLQPGQQQLVVEFQQTRESGILNQSPRIELPGGATNLALSYTLPRDRWPLYISGPSIGPAMLYWGVLCVILLGALALTWLASRLQLAVPVNLLGWVLLGLGLSTVNSYGVLVVAVFFFALAARRLYIDPFSMSRPNFHLLQIFLVFWGVVTAFCVVAAIPLGLLANPEMKVVGNGSYSHFYKYYQDAVSADEFPRVTVISVPLFAYRVVMLLWSLWLSTRIIEWARWGWQCYSNGVAWRRKDAAVAVANQNSNNT